MSKDTFANAFHFLFGVIPNYIFVIFQWFFFSSPHLPSHKATHLDSLHLNGHIVCAKINLINFEKENVVSHNDQQSKTAARRGDSVRNLLFSAFLFELLERLLVWIKMEGITKKSKRKLQQVEKGVVKKKKIANQGWKKGGRQRKAVSFLRFAFDWGT